jgi:transposase-like protein
VGDEEVVSTKGDYGHDHPSTVTTSSGKRQYRSSEEKRRVVEETLAAEVSVATIARMHGINANQVSHWRKLYHAGAAAERARENKRRRHEACAFAAGHRHRREHPRQHLRNFHGIQQADAYAGFNQLYADGSIQQAPCLAHIRRKFLRPDGSPGSPIATEAIQRIASLYEIALARWDEFVRYCGYNGTIRAPAARDGSYGNWTGTRGMLQATGS